MGTFDRTPYIKQFETFMSESLSRADGYNPEVRLAYKNYLNGAIPQRIESFRNMVGKKERDFYESKAKFEGDRMLEEGNFVGYETLHRTRLDAGSIQQPEYDYLVGGMQVDSLLMQADRYMDMEDPANAMIALNQIDITTLDDARRESYKQTKLNVEASLKRYELVRNEEFNQDAHAVANLPVDDFLAQWPKKRKELSERTDIPTSVRDAALKKGDDRRAVLAKGGYDPIEEFDIKSYREMERKILEDSTSVVPSDITGLSAPTWAMDKLLKVKDAAESGDMPIQQKRALEMLDRIRTLRIRYEDTTTEESIERDMYERTNDFLNWSMSEQGKNATDEQVEKKLQSLTTPIAQDVSLNLVQKLFSHIGGRSGAFIGLPKALRFDTPAEQIADEHIGELKRLGVWDELSDAEKEDVRKGLMSGKTAQDFLDLYYAE